MSGNRTCSWFPECRYILCKDVANERKENLFLISRVQLYLMQRCCKRAERELVLNFPSAAISYAKVDLFYDNLSYLIKNYS